MLLRPLNNRYMVEPIKDEEQKIGNIYIPDNAQEKPNVGIVIAVAYGTDGQVLEGNKVVYGHYAGVTIKVNHVEYLLISGEDILAVLED